MAQEIKIPVSADTKGAEKGLEGVADAGEAIAASMHQVREAARQAAEQLERVARIRNAWQKSFGQSISQGDAARIDANFGEAQKRGIGRAGAKAFTDAEGWILGHRNLYRKAREADRHEDYMRARLSEGTSFAFRPPEPAGGGSGGGSGGGGASDYSRGTRRIASTAMGFGRSMLALAGIGGALALANRAKDLSTEEGVGTDTLKRRMGDLGIDFQYLRQQARAAGDGLGVTYVESMRFASAYGKEVGNLGATDLTGEGLSHRMRGIYGFSRAFGVDPGEGTQFFGQMGRYGVGRDEIGQRRLAMLIGDAVARSGYSGKVEDFMRSIADYTATSARMILNTPNSSAYANALTSLASRGLPGLDPESAARILGAADSSIRRGGAMGNASLNFSYAALRNASPGMHPVDAMALMEGGLFGTTRSVFGGPLGQYMGKGVALDDVTNFDKMMPLMRSHYGNGGYFLNAVKNHFGLSSMAQAAVLANMSTHGQLGATSNLMTAAGINPMMVNAGGLATLGQVANAKGSGELMTIFGQVMARKDLTEAQKRSLTMAVSGAGNDTEALRRALGSQVAGLNQEDTEGNRTRQALTGITDALTAAGSPLLSVLNPIREAVIALASHLVPGYMDTTGSRPDGTAPWAATGSRGGKLPHGAQVQLESGAMDFFMAKGWSHDQAAAIVGRLVAESGMDSRNNGDGGKALGLAQWHADRWKHYRKWMAENGFTDPYDYGSQEGFIDAELRGKGGDSVAGQAGYMLQRARNRRERGIALLAYERPKGFHYGRIEHPEAVAGWQNQMEATQRIEGAVDVRLHLPDGSKHKVSVPLVGKPVPAGASSNPFLPAPSAPARIGATPFLPHKDPFS